MGSKSLVKHMASTHLSVLPILDFWVFSHLYLHSLPWWSHLISLFNYHEILLSIASLSWGHSETLGRNSSFKVSVSCSALSHPHEAEQLQFLTEEPKEAKKAYYLQANQVWGGQWEKSELLHVLVGWSTVCQVLWHLADPFLADRWGGRGLGRLSPKR